MVPPCGGHNGGDAGVVTDMFFDPATQRGYIILTNGNAFNGPVMSILMNSGPDDWYEEPIAMSCELPVALSGSSDEVQLSISPNPAANHTRIMGTPVPGSRYRISDMEGRLSVTGPSCRQTASSALPNCSTEATCWNGATGVLQQHVY